MAHVDAIRPVLAHPLTQPGAVPLSPVAAAALVVLVVGVAGWLWLPPREGRKPADRPADSWEGELGRGMIVTRAVAVGVLLMAILAGRLGADDQLRNIAPALVVAIIWPFLLAGSAVVGPVWRWVDPWDGAARSLSRGGAAVPAGDVRWAVVPAAAWVWYLSAFGQSLQPRAVGAALGVYTVVTVGGALALGRVAWLSRAEVFGLLFGWVARMRRGLLVGWQPPRGASLVLGVLAGGLVFGLVRGSELWRTVGSSAEAGAFGVVASALAMAGLAAILGRWGDGGVAASLIPVVVGVGMALAMARSRLLLAVLLLPRLASDPFGLGWDLFGAAGAPLPTDPLTPGTRTVLQLAVLGVSAIAVAAVTGRRLDPRRRLPALLGAAVPLAVAALAVVDT